MLQFLPVYLYWLIFITYPFALLWIFSIVNDVGTESTKLEFLTLSGNYRAYVFLFFKCTDFLLFLTFLFILYYVYYKRFGIALQYGIHFLIMWLVAPFVWDVMRDIFVPWQSVVMCPPLGVRTTYCLFYYNVLTGYKA